MLRRKLLTYLLIVGCFWCVGGCHDDDDDFRNDFAPDSLSGKTYRFVITEVTGLPTVLTAGTFRIAFQTGVTYLATPETENLSSFEGAYIYTKRERNAGELTFTVTMPPEEVVYICTLWFTNNISGDCIGMLKNDNSMVGLFSGTFQQI
ncbi:hypothetical protein U14_02349 [Candidatus Moduliflexus flocculans]|uniref:Uncharacterized protein n=1 Tax=Candidatus Moduliflexus flocculans TaxID=1499966 RepID=A0A0S6VZG7_9BACT|nr:hypothetical protein U14_02349 [Candidatus Moduliflexus flocculans]